MKKILQVITREDDMLADDVADANLAADDRVRVVRLSPGRTDYEELLEAVFEADSVQSW
ncbi:MAG TPA: hypothetical protein VGH19_00395 [Verrucomicrobiae bacterium]